MIKKKGKIVAIIQSRMGSMRLPGKVFKSILGKPMLELLIERIKRAENLDEIILASSTNSQDDVLEALALKIGISCYRGSEEDVLDRFLKAAQLHDADYVVQLWGDNPLIDPQIIDDAISFYMANDFDCVGTHLNRTFPLGMSMIIFSMKLLQEVSMLALEPVYREHVSGYIYEDQKRYSTGHLPCPDDLCRPTIRLSVDELPDFELVTKIFETLYPVNPNFNIRDILVFLDSHPELLDINKFVKQRHPFKKIFKS